MNSLPRILDFQVWLVRIAGLTIVFSILVSMDVPEEKKLVDLSVTITSESPKFKLDGDISLTFSVENKHGKKVKFCRYMTPFEGFNGDILDVTNEKGEKVPYLGIKKKRGKPGKSDFILLDAGEKKTVSFQLDKAYPIALSGTYHVQFKGNKYMNQLPDSNRFSIEVVGQ